MCYRSHILFDGLLIALLSCGLILSPQSSASEPVRTPVVAGMWYPADRSALLEMLKELDNRAAATPVNPPRDAVLKALIMPHAGFVYSGWTAAHAGRLLQPHQFAKVIVLGPDHRVGFRYGAISDVSAYQTPLGRVPLHADAAELRRTSPYFRAIAASDRSEHCLEAVIPFLQYYLKAFQMVPVVLGATSAAPIAAAIDPYLDDQTLLVVSSDLSHFLTYDAARQKDFKTIEAILTLADQKLASDRECACGRTPISVLLQLAKKHAWQPMLLHYSNSGDTGGNRARVVGYAALAFYGKPQMQTEPLADCGRPFTAQQGQALINLARQSIYDHLGLSGTGRPDMVADLDEPCYQARCGTFVTLKKAGRLRGCIGNFGRSETVYSGIRQNALRAAFQDPRFPSLAAGETDQLQISISILGDPRPLDYTDSRDLLSKLRPQIDGVIIRHGSASATFLPQVWQDLPRKTDFLSHLCRKAGLAADAWQKRPLEVYIYQVQHFDEQQ